MSSTAGSPKTEEPENPPFETRAEETLQLWTQSPDLKDEVFQNVIGEKSRKSEIYVPPDESLAIWTASPNKEQHASFGADGTTASATCDGDLIQMTRYLGVGHSGLFAMDKTTTGEPYFVVSRAEDLTNMHSFLHPFLLKVPKKYLPETVERPDVKWVNWRWPRYDYRPNAQGVQVSIQYMVQEAVVLQQIVITNQSSDRVEVELPYRSPPGVLIRDLDVMDKNHTFNERDTTGYWHSLGPGGYGHIVVNSLDLPHHEEGNPPPAACEQHGASPRAHSAGNDELGEAKEESPQIMTSSHVDSHEPQVEPCNEEKSIKEGTEMLSDQAKHVATIISMFVDGAAENMAAPASNISAKDGFAMKMKDPQEEEEEGEEEGEEREEIYSRSLKRELLGASELTSPERQRQSQLDIVIAYKLIPVMEAKVKTWKTFMVSAQEANLNHHLRNETTQFWLGQTPLSALNFPTLDQVDHTPSSSPTTTSSAANNDRRSREARNTATAGETIYDGKGPSQVSVPDLAPLSNPTRRGHQGNLEQHNDSRKPLAGELKSASGQPKPFLEYLAWRHLEHILSVCALPVCVSRLEAPILYVLTSGDMAGHRISTSASFFAFLFLIDMARRLKMHNAIGTHPYLKNLLDRIHHICHGHLRWLQRLRQGGGRLLQCRCFAANYWPNGQIIPPSGGWTWQPQDLVTDTAIQISKITLYLDLQREQKPDGIDISGMDGMLNEIYAYWLIELDNTDSRAFSAWHRTKVDGIYKFRLEDHFWIWKSLESLERHTKVKEVVKTLSKTEKDPVFKTFYDDTGKSEEGCKKMMQRLASDRVRRQVLQRFTTENDVLGMRMLALTRTATDSRFMLHARDHVLFWGEKLGGEKLGFFSSDTGDSYKELWQRTLKSQPYHEGNETNKWTNTTRHALGIAVGSQGNRLNASSAQDLLVACTETLVNSCGHNGFFSGLLKEGTNDPALFDTEEDRDFYFSAGFEIHCLLLQHSKKITETFKAKKTLLDTESKPVASHNKKINIDTRLDALCSVVSELADTIKMNPSSRLSKAAVDSGMVPRNVVLKKLIPTNSLVDTTNITLIDDEWLYDQPKFFTGVGPYSNKYDVMKYVFSVGTSPTEDLGKVITDCIAQFARAGGFTHPIHTIVYDAPKLKRLGKRDTRSNPPRPPYNYRSSERLLEDLAARRTPETAKKRFIWLRTASHEAAFISWLSTVDLAEQISLSQFFDCHDQYSKLVMDDTNRLLNAWKTEVHLSFFVLEENQGQKDQTKIVNLAPIPQLFSQRLVVRASMSFRFNGDFFDRFWTCHIVDRVSSFHIEADVDPGQPNFRRLSSVSYDSGMELDKLPLSADSPMPWDLGKEKTSTGSHKPQWQRRVLEISLVTRMLTPMVKASKDILDLTHRHLGINDKDYSPSHLDNVSDLESTREWPAFERCLQIWEDDLTSTLEKLKEWDSRERDRGKEQPRWTRNDEKKYRGNITKFQAAYQSEVRKIISTRDQLRKLKDKLSNQRERLEKISEFHGNENIRYFTYVTIIFLPLGFATSFYSMSGPPDPGFLAAVVEFAVVAFAVTLLLILSFKPATKAFKPAGEVYRLLFGASKTLFRRAEGKLADGFDYLRASRILASTQRFLIQHIGSGFTALRGDTSSDTSIPTFFGRILAGFLILFVMGLLWPLRLMIYNLSDFLKKIYRWAEKCQEKLIQTLRTLAQEDQGSTAGSSMASTKPNSWSSHTSQGKPPGPKSAFEKWLPHLMEIPTGSRLRPLTQQHEQQGTEDAGNRANPTDIENVHKQDEEQ